VIGLEWVAVLFARISMIIVSPEFFMGVGMVEYRGTAAGNLQET